MKLPESRLPTPDSRLPSPESRSTDWYGCYSGGRGDLFTPESNRHPAKMAVALCYRIFEHGRERGYWKPGDVILDPMAGIGTTLVCGLSLGYNVVGVELEQHFVELCWKNLTHACEKIGPLNVKADFWLAMGDARRLSQILNCELGIMNAAVTGPLYAEGLGHDSGHPRLDAIEDGRRRREGCARRSGYSGAVTSPPYLAAPSGGVINVKGYGPDGADKVGERTYSDKTVSGAISSPPYGDQAVLVFCRAEIRNLGREGKWHEAIAMLRKAEEVQVGKGNKYSASSDAYLRGVIEQALQAEHGNYSGAISSPPYADQDLTGQGHFRSRFESNKPSAAANPHEGYARALETRKSKIENGQIGNLRDPHGDIDRLQHSAFSLQPSAETYLSAMLAVYRELHAVLKPGGVVCLVTKNPVKKGAIRRLDEDTIRLMEAAGFALIERFRAMLSQDLGGQYTIEGSVELIRRERKSFFKQLFERKRPDLKVDHEDVLFFRKLETMNGELRTANCRLPTREQG